MKQAVGVVRSWKVPRALRNAGVEFPFEWNLEANGAAPYLLQQRGSRKAQVDSWRSAGLTNNHNPPPI